MGNKGKKSVHTIEIKLFLFASVWRVVLRWAYLGSQDVGCDRGDADAAETTGQGNELEQHSSR